MNSRRKIFDAHVHLPDGLPDLENAVEVLLQQLEEAQVEKCALLHLLNQPWRFENVSEAVSDHAGIMPVVQMDPKKKEAPTKLKRYVEGFGARALKIHPRLTPCNLTERPVTDLIKTAGDLGIPVIIDAFPSGEALAQGAFPTQFAQLAENCAESTLIFAHMGGHYALDFMMIAKAYKNAHLDCSFSINYYNMEYLDQVFSAVIAHTPPGKILFGSDYPFNTISQAIQKADKLLQEQPHDDMKTDNFYFSSAEDIFSA